MENKVSKKQILYYISLLVFACLAFMARYFIKEPYIAYLDIAFEILAFICAIRIVGSPETDLNSATKVIILLLAVSGLDAFMMISKSFDPIKVVRLFLLIFLFIYTKKKQQGAD